MSDLVVEIKLGRCVMGSRKSNALVCGNEAKDWPWPDGPAKLGYGIAQIQCAIGANATRAGKVSLCGDNRKLGAYSRNELKIP